MGTGGRGVRQSPAALARAAGVAVLAGVAALAGAAVLVAACGGGGSHGPESGAASGQTLSQALDAYASCIRGHGVPDFYFSRQAGTPSPPPAGVDAMDFHGWIAMADLTPRFQAAQKTCRHLLPAHIPPTTAELHQQFVQALKAARCMRAHGYPDWPDPVANLPAAAAQAGAPPGVDTGSPHFQAAAKACGVGPIAPS
jgi:hypothetical protein